MQRHTVTLELVVTWVEFYKEHLLRWQCGFHSIIPNSPSAKRTETSHSTSSHAILSYPILVFPHKNYENYEISEHSSTVFFKLQIGFIKWVFI